MKFVLERTCSLYFGITLYERLSWAWVFWQDILLSKHYPLFPISGTRVFLILQFYLEMGKMIFC